MQRCKEHVAPELKPRDVESVFVRNVSTKSFGLSEEAFKYFPI